MKQPNSPFRDALAKAMLIEHGWSAEKLERFMRDVKVYERTATRLWEQFKSQ